MVNVAPGGVLLFAAITSIPLSEIQNSLLSLNMDALYSMIVAIAALWAASYVGTAVAMGRIKNHGKN